MKEENLLFNMFAAKMSTKIIFETDRLLVREFNLEDANFIIELLNTPSWLQFIGDRSVSTVKDAEGYLKNGPIKSYKENGFGLWMVAFKDSLRPIGMCGLLKRDALDDVDIGFALLPEYAGSGYGFEAAAATLRYAKNSLTISKVIAITSPENITSINLLGKLGLRFARTAYITGDKPSLVFEPEGNSNDLSEINTLTELFFEVFTSTNGRIPDVKNIHNFFVKEIGRA
ncbi:MAG: GNAT family N-acetyltransferase, partial [Cyclobacteriaceae bacterium]